MTDRRVAVLAAAGAVAVLGIVGAFAAAGIVPAGSPGGPSDTSTPAAPDGTTIDHDGDGLTLENDPGQVVSGTTDLDAGSELVVRLRSTNGTSPFIVQANATVGEDGRFEATVDLSNVAADTPFAVSVRHDDEELANESGLVVEGSVPESTPSEDSPVTLDHEGDAVTLENAAEQTVSGTADLPEGSEVTVRLRSSDGDQPFIKQATTTVDGDGRFAASFDMSGIDSGVTFTVTVRHDGETVGETSGEVVDGDG